MNTVWILLCGFLFIHCRCERCVDPKLLDVPEINYLERMVNGSYLLQHSFLECFAMGDFANMTEAAAIFAVNHYVYSKNFINYLETVAAKIDDDEMRRPILENINEELGNYSPQDIELMTSLGIDEESYNHIPHQYLSQRFFESLGLDTSDIPVIVMSNTKTSVSYDDPPGVKFTKYMMDLYRDTNACESLAIIGFAIEETVSKLYEYIWSGLQHHTQLPSDQVVFFPIHIVLDDGHADLLKLAFKYYLSHDRSMCDNAEEIIRIVLKKRIALYNDVRREIEETQGYQCRVPYDHVIDDDAEEDTTVHTDAAVRQAQAQTLKYNALGDATWTIQEKMSLSARILAKQGHGGTLSGQITCRHKIEKGDPDTTMLVNSYGKPLELVTPHDLLVIDGDLNVMNGTGFANKATRFHFHVYKKRADIRCIVHTHPLAASALSMTGHELFISHMDTMVFYDDVQYLPAWPGIPFGDEEGDIIAGLLSDGYWSALLGHHGLIVGGRSIEEATYRAFFFEKAARMQLDALAAVGGDINRLKRTDPGLSGKARDWRVSEGPVKAHFNGWAQISLNENPPF